MSNQWLDSLGERPPMVLGQLTGLDVYPRSLAEIGEALLFLAREGCEHRLGILSPGAPPDGFAVASRPVEVEGRSFNLSFGETCAANAAALRALLPWTAPSPVGLAKSAGLGDRLGNATPGHIRALRHVSGIVPFFAQQSIREMERTGRSPQGVIDTATWGVFQEGWRSGYGADADHLKVFKDIDVCVAAGYVMYTFDPRDQVDDDAQTDGLDTLREKYATLPWDGLETTPDAVRDAYLGREWPLDDGDAITFSEAQLLRAACKYGAGLAHIAAMYRHLHKVIGDRPCEVEVSVDETETPTTPEEHLYIASELKRLGVEWVSLAPRYVGRFEKGVDYIGDLDTFAASFARHVAVARAMGPYKLSLHSGSDKFSIYPIVAELADGLVHLKTAGTSYLEALRAVSRVDPVLFREILGFAIAHYETDRASYHVSAELKKMVVPGAVLDENLSAVLDQFDTRQALHVTFGTVLTVRNDAGEYIYRDALYEVLDGNKEAHYAALEAHIVKHLVPFSD